MISNMIKYYYRIKTTAKFLIQNKHTHTHKHTNTNKHTHTHTHKQTHTKTLFVLCTDLVSCRVHNKCARISHVVRTRSVRLSKQVSNYRVVLRSSSFITD